ncbi:MULTISPECIES: acyl-CoA dehydrogenase family protein [Mycolicibacterium]|jgi:alkylation response protein AidB-like acyl-CoA dehydrogenase|uniref:Acyl-CoA dehydrogenase n=4 Tax=Mycolicibacterium TaxID=1866885 RepID=A0A0N9XQE1_MYCFO|nr:MULTISPECIES: acyl-CoA dehydrogenase family protein [Mycolicibacterium]AIY45867.1 putative acyl-CoA dehydrogenase [Mycobacterium sp. VKM Ac-1817D]CRL76453.1 acyl-CoA dehydrogenase domain-containing protein [Mycolicibacter nonchromogenicus]ALI25926.1 putative acyl-CoA dehydrogenase [Mycolicibacterium fortuitum]EJZ05391.1 acyl-CoA dehydrogenase [Mycolicibacterium fortuitum subsp. fortuitum DSM 46621 = ATCC 6841 = JCM 6387]KMV16758.1 acyl-CoA dehydrogenase [Mycolicibacterium conceptionense]
MAINLEMPRKLQAVIEKGHQGAAEMLRPISRKYDLAEHAYPVELDTLATLFEGISEAKTISFAGAEAFRDDANTKGEKVTVNGANMSALLNALEISWGDVALLLSVPRQGLGNAAISSVATPEQLERLGKDVWAAMAITEPGFGSDSAAVTTTAVLDGDEYVINGEKIFVTAGSRATHIVVWATLDKSLGRAAIKSFIVPREHPGVTVERLEHKLGIKASDTAVIRFENARIPKDNLLGDPEVHVEKGFAGVMETFDNTRPIVAAMAVGIARAALEDLRAILTEAGIEISYDKPAHAQSAPAAEFLRMEADWEAGYLLTVRSAWQADNSIPNSKEASMGKAKAARVASDITLKAVEMAGTVGYSEQTLLEKWARDSKILDIFEGTQQIQQLVVARRLLGLSSAELK